MIFVTDKGRMCNNILQYGQLYAWGREHGRKTMSMRFAYKYQYFHICQTPNHHVWDYLFAKYAARLGLIPTVGFHDYKADTSHQERIMMEKRMVLAEGWCVIWFDLFLKYKQEILQLFAFHDDIEQRVAQRMHEGLRLGVHIRRGDYATFQGGRFYYTDEQYLQLIRSFCTLHPDETIHVYICGNDPDLNRDYFRQQLPQCHVEFPDGNPAEDLCLLSHCDYLIGATSTFTLVASMYHDAPLYWIGDADAPVEEHLFKSFDELLPQLEYVFVYNNP